MRILIVDDETPAREELEWLLEQCSMPGISLDVVGQAASSEAALAFIRDEDKPIDLVFLDIDMPGIGGVRLAELWQRVDHVDEQERAHQSTPMVIFMTAYQEHAVDAFELDAVDYLLKPVRLERLQRALHKTVWRMDRTQETPPNVESIKDMHVTRTLSRISVEDQGVYRVIPTSQILFFESEDGIVVAQTEQGRYITDFSLKFLEQNLEQGHFFRSHRSYIVQLDAISSIAPWGAGTYKLILDREKDLGVPLARSRAHDLKSLIPWSASVFDD